MSLSRRFIFTFSASEKGITGLGPGLPGCLGAWTDPHHVTLTERLMSARSIERRLSRALNGHVHIAGGEDTPPLVG